MTGESSRWPAALAAAVLGLFFVVASTTLFSWLQVYSLKVRPLVALAVWAGFTLPLVSGGCMIILLGYLADLASGGLVGMQITSLMVVFLAGSLAGRRLEISSWPLQIVAVFTLSLVYQLVFWGALNLAPRLHIQPANFPLVIIPQAAADALLAPFFIFMVGSLVDLVENIWRHMSTKHKRRSI